MHRCTRSNYITEPRAVWPAHACSYALGQYANRGTSIESQTGPAPKLATGALRAPQEEIYARKQSRSTKFDAGSAEKRRSQGRSRSGAGTDALALTCTPSWDTSKNGLLSQRMSCNTAPNHPIYYATRESRARRPILDRAHALPARHNPAGTYQDLDFSPEKSCKPAPVSTPRTTRFKLAVANGCVQETCLRPFSYSSYNPL
jgi:hypothetical protein